MWFSRNYYRNCISVFGNVSRKFRKVSLKFEFNGISGHCSIAFNVWGFRKSTKSNKRQWSFKKIVSKN